MHDSWLRAMSFGKSYTVPILKDKNAVHCKSITVDDFHGISISPARVMRGKCPHGASVLLLIIRKRIRQVAVPVMPVYSKDGGPVVC